MQIGLPKEIKREEYRVGLTPESASEYIRKGHPAMVETGAGLGSGFSDAQYAEVGCTIEGDKRRLFDRCDMIIKVKEPLAEEFDLFHEGQLLYTYLHLAAAKPLAEALLARKVTAIAYETVTEADGSLPLLKPMSEIAGRLSVQEGAKCLEKCSQGRGVLLGGVSGIRRGKVAILGGGSAGTNACRVAVGLGAEVCILDISARRLSQLEDIFGSAITTLHATAANLAQCTAEADLVIGAVLIPGAAAPKLLRREHLARMKPGSAIVDIAVDQGGCCETTRPTTHAEPTFIEGGVVHYCVANMPGAVPLSSTYALTSVTNPYGLLIAALGAKKAAAEHPAIRSGINTMDGRLYNRPVSEALLLPCTAW